MQKIEKYRTTNIYPSRVKNTEDVLRDVYVRFSGKHSGNVKVNKEGPVGKNVTAFADHHGNSGHVFPIRPCFEAHVRGRLQ